MSRPESNRRFFRQNAFRERKRSRVQFVFAISLSAVALLTRSQHAFQLPIHRVLIVGATHGNELTGAWLLRRIQHSPTIASRPSLDSVETVIGNPKAYAETRRFIDVDLNRQFREVGSRDGHSTGYEHQRAKALDAQYGHGATPTSPDFVLDLHTTTSAMGITYIAESWSDVGVAAAVWCQRFLQPRIAAGELPQVRILYNDMNRSESQNVPSLARQGLTIEVGPVPQGVLRHDACEWMEAATSAFFDFLEAANSNGAELPERATVFWERREKVAAPLDGDGKPTAVFHKAFQDSDFRPVRMGDALFMSVTGEVIPYDGLHGSVIWPVFVNEGGYYLPESGLGFGVALRREIDVPNVTAK